MGLGTDIVSIERIRAAMRNPRFLNRILTRAEQGYCREAETVAGRWAAKEAIQKALPMRVKWTDIEVLPGERGEPLARVPHPYQVMVSIAHEREYAVATAILLAADQA